ncbi:hypothetical protein ACQPYE_17295 [Actinosynnema sp. CA-299493]
MIDQTGPYGAKWFFAGDLLLRLVAEGRLVLEPAESDRVVEGLRTTLRVLTERVHVIELLRGTSLDNLRRAHPEVERAVVDAVFTDQVSGGGLSRALEELPKYIEAFENAGKRPAGAVARDVEGSAPTDR